MYVLSIGPAKRFENNIQIFTRPRKGNEKDQESLFFFFLNFIEIIKKKRWTLPYFPS